MKEPITTEKVTDTALTRSIISSVIGIVLCMVCLFGTTWAWYSSSVTSGVSVTEGANFDFNISIGDSITPIDGVYTFVGGEHTVTLTKTGTAEKGFCKVEAKKSGEEAEATTYYIVDFTGKETIHFTVKGSGTLKLIPMWGTPAEGYNNLIPDNGIALTPDPEGEASYSETVAATIVEGNNTVFFSTVTPSNENGKQTKVTVPASVKAFAVAAGSTTTMTIEATPTVAANKTFTISSNGAVGAIDLTVKVNNEVISEFKDESGHAVPVIVETYIAKNLTNVSLAYGTETWTQVANESDVNAVGKLYYDKTTGRMLYTTNHFSTFVLGADEVAYLERTNTAYLTVNEAVNKAQTGDTVTLLKDYDQGTGSEKAYQGALVGDKDVTVDLNGMKYTGQFLYGAFIAQKGKLTIEDSSSGKTGLIKNTLNDNNPQYAALCATSGGTIVLNSGTVEGYAYGIYQHSVDSEEKGNTTIINGGEVKVQGYAINAFDYDTIIINGGKVTSTSGYALMNNGSDTAASTMTMTGGEVYGSVEAIYHPGRGTCTISGGKLTGGETGIEMRAGTLNVTGGTIIGNATPTSISPNGNGMTSSGAGIAIAQHTTKLPISVNISGGKINGYSALYESNPQGNSADDLAKINIDVTGGEFNCINNGTVSVYSADKTGFIKGGTFSSDPTAYVVSNYSAIETDGIWSVAASN